MPPYVSTIIFLPVKPASPIGPPITNRPVGFINTVTFFVSMFSSLIIGSITNFFTSGANFFSRSTSGACCEEITIVFKATGLSA